MPLRLKVQLKHSPVLHVPSLKNYLHATSSKSRLTEWVWSMMYLKLSQAFMTLYCIQERTRRIVLLTRGIIELLSVRFELLLCIKNKRLGFHSISLHTLPKVHISAIPERPCNGPEHISSLGIAGLEHQKRQLSTNYLLGSGASIEGVPFVLCR